MKDNRTSSRDKQFQLSQEYYLKGLDFTDWYRYYFIIKNVIQLRPRRILEIGIGNRIVENCLEPYVEEYTTMDLNPGLQPDILGDLRDFQPKCEGRFEAVICSEVLEHLPFQDLEPCLNNIRGYLTEGGKAIITLPHRRNSFLFISPTYKHYLFALPIWTTPAGFVLRFLKRKVIIDPNHHWEIGDINTRRGDVEARIKRSGFRITAFSKLLYVDFWLLERA